MRQTIFAMSFMLSIIIIIITLLLDCLAKASLFTRYILSPALSEHFSVTFVEIFLVDVHFWFEFANLKQNYFFPHFFCFVCWLVVLSCPWQWAVYYYVLQLIYAIFGCPPPLMQLVFWCFRQEECLYQEHVQQNCFKYRAVPVFAEQEETRCKICT